MIIDLICDRMDGKPYDPKEFYDEVIQYEHSGMIGYAMDYGTEFDVIAALQEYVRINDYSPVICKWIATQTWLSAPEAEPTNQSRTKTKKQPKAPRQTTKTYTVEWDYQGSNYGHYWTIHRSKQFEATSREEARRQFDEWHNDNGMKRYNGKLRHPFHIKIRRS